MAIKLLKNYQKFGDHEVGYVQTDTQTQKSQYCWSTYYVENLEPCDALRLVLDYDIMSYSNKIGIAITNSPEYPGSSSTGQLTSTDYILKPKRGPISSAGHGWGKNRKLDVIIQKSLEKGTYYIHMGYEAKDDTYAWTGLHIHKSTSFIEISQKRTYAIKYDSQQGINTPEQSFKTHGVPFQITNQKPTKKGYTFQSWNTKSDGSGTSYASSATYEEDKELSLFAQWSLNTLTIKMHVNGGIKSKKASSNMSIKDDIALYNNKNQIINYGEGSFKLWQCNNPSWISLTKSGKIITSGKEFSSSQDGTGTVYSQAVEYNIQDFANIENGSVEITLYVNWKSGGLVRLSDGTKWESYQVYVSDGTKWEHHIPYISDGSKWDMYS